MAPLNLTINGETRACATAHVGELLNLLQLHGKRIAVELNGSIVPRSAYSTTTLQDGDTLEIVVAVGGG